MLPRTKRNPERARFLAAVLNAGVNSIAYWAKIRDYAWYDPDVGQSGACLFNKGEANAYVTVEDEGSELGPGVVKTIGVDDIADAMKRIACGQVEGLRHGEIYTIRVNNATNGQHDGRVERIDAALADVIMQVAVLGEVMYG